MSLTMSEWRSERPRKWWSPCFPHPWTRRATTLTFPWAWTFLLASMTGWGDGSMTRPWGWVHDWSTMTCCFFVHKTFIFAGFKPFEHVWKHFACSRASVWWFLGVSVIVHITYCSRWFLFLFICYVRTLMGCFSPGQPSFRQDHDLHLKKLSRYLKTVRRSPKKFIQEVEKTLGREGNKEDVKTWPGSNMLKRPEAGFREVYGGEDHGRFKVVWGVKDCIDLPYPFWGQHGSLRTTCLDLLGLSHHKPPNNNNWGRGPTLASRYFVHWTFVPLLP